MMMRKATDRLLGGVGGLALAAVLYSPPFCYLFDQ